MPNDEGLRQCNCGKYVLISDMISQGNAETSDLPIMDRVPGELLRACVSVAESEALEMAARLSYWRHLNHPYRETVLLDLEAQRFVLKSAWEAMNPDQRTWLDKLRGLAAPMYEQQVDIEPTYADFEATKEQRKNMLRLIELLGAENSPSPRRHVIDLAELYRELGLFDEAESMIESIDERDASSHSEIVAKLIGDRQTAPALFRM